MRTMKCLAAGLLLAIATTSNAFAGHHHNFGPPTTWKGGGCWNGDGGFSAATLNGSYVFEATGYATNGTGDGQLSILGTLTFDGVSAVTENLIVTASDGSQFSCALTATTGSYTIASSSSAPGLGTLNLPTTDGSINFAVLVPRSAGVTADVIESDGSFTGVSICSFNPVAMVLRGNLKALPDGDWTD